MKHTVKIVKKIIKLVPLETKGINEDIVISKLKITRQQYLDNWHFISENNLLRFISVLNGAYIYSISYKGYDYLELHDPIKEVKSFIINILAGGIGGVITYLLIAYFPK